jgi:predicted nucleic acid-binding protein
VTVTIDASILSAFLLEEDDHEKIHGLLLKGTCATELVVTESCNAVLMALKRGRLSNEQAEKAMQALMSLVGSNIKIFPLKEDILWDVFRIARENGLVAYDAIYIALAKRKGGSLASRDPKQIEAAKKSGIKIVSV